jgi:hypothetical protein
MVVLLAGLQFKFVLTGSRLEVQPDGFGGEGALLDFGRASSASARSGWVLVYGLRFRRMKQAGRDG